MPMVMFNGMKKIRQSIHYYVHQQVSLQECLGLVRNRNRKLSFFSFVVEILAFAPLIFNLFFCALFGFIWRAGICVIRFYKTKIMLGGGMVKGPLMLAMGVLPTVSAASSSVMIFCTSFTATTSNIVFGLLLPDYGLLLFTVGFLSTLLGQMCLSYLMKQSKRNSYIAFSIGFVVLISAILMTFQSILSIITKVSEGTSATLLESPGGICA
jgi:uncharacterized membrane protein YfcA